MGYIFGFNALHQGENIQDVIWIGIVSNGLASIILFAYGIIGIWSNWSDFAKIYMWGSAIVTALITLGLSIAGW